MKQRRWLWLLLIPLVTLPLLSACRQKPPAEEEEIGEDLSCYVGLSDFKGLDLYVWRRADGSLACGLLPGTNRLKTREEIDALAEHPATPGQMKRILAGYGIPDEYVQLYPCRPAGIGGYRVDKAFCLEASAAFDGRFVCLGIYREDISGTPLS